MMSTHQNNKSLQAGSVETSTVQNKHARISKRKVPILASVVLGLVLTLLTPTRVAAASASSLDDLASLAALSSNASVASGKEKADDDTSSPQSESSSDTDMTMSLSMAEEFDTQREKEMCITNPDSGETYTILKRLSSGAEGITYTARDSSGRIVCLKSSPASCIGKARFEAEWLDVMNQNFPESFPEIYECFVATGNDTNGEPAENAFIAMHFFQGYKQLKNFVSEYGGPIPAHVATGLLRQIVEICVNIHSLSRGTGRKRKKCYHGDFNFKNIMIRNDGCHVVVIDPKNNPRSLFYGKNAREAKDMYQVAAHALYLAVGDNQMSLADLRQKHMGVFNFIAACMGDMLDGYSFEEKIGEGNFITQSLRWWSKHGKQNVIASATTMRDFMNANAVYVDARSEEKLNDDDSEGLRIKVSKVCKATGMDGNSTTSSEKNTTTGSSVDFSKMSYEELIARDPDHFAKMSFEELLARERTEGRHTLEHNYNADHAPRFSDRIRTMKILEMKKLLREIEHEISVYQKHGRLDEVRDMQAERDQLVARIERKTKAGMNNIFAAINRRNGQC